MEKEASGFKIYIGGRWGKKISHGKALNKIFTDKDEAMAVIEKAILLFKDQGLAGERFAVTVERLGFENVEAQLLADDLLNRKEEILAAEIRK
jgi:NAD(P)H-nitrite reductase large subunit